MSLLRNVVVVFFRRQASERRRVRALPADISLPGTHNTADIYSRIFSWLQTKKTALCAKPRAGGREGSNCVTNTVYTHKETFCRCCSGTVGFLLVLSCPPTTLSRFTLRHLTLLLMGSNPAVLHDRLSCYPHLLVMTVCVWA